jgi:hypothetical protein
MAYTGNSLSLISSTIEGNFNVAAYLTTDSIATVEGANYISDGQTRGLEVGDIVFVLCGATPGAYVPTICQVSAVQTGGNGVTLSAMAISAVGTGAAQVNTSIATTGATGTLTAAAIVGGVITRTGPTAAFTDTTATAAQIIAAMTTQVVGNAWRLIIVNDTAFTETLAAGANVTLSGETILPPNSWGEFLVTYNGTGTVTIYGIAVSANTALPAAKYSTSSVTTGSLAAGLITGAIFTVWNSTNGTPGAQLVRTAAQMLADIPGAQVGDSFMFRIINSGGSGVLTLTADSGATVTMTGTMTIANAYFRDFILTFNTAATATVQQVGIGTTA